MADIDLNPIPIDDENKQNDDDDGDDFLVPLPVDESNNNDNDIEMKDESTTDNSNNNTNNLNTEEMIIEEEIEEEETEGGIIEEEIIEEAEEGGIIAPPPQKTEAKSASPPKPQPKSTSNTNNTQQQKTEEGDNRPRCHQITTDISKPRYLNIHVMDEWTNNEVVAWLTHRFGLWGQQYVPAFANKKINGKQLLQLTEEELKNEYGITKTIHLYRICRDIQDAKRPISQINRIISPAFIDGGSAASKLMRFGAQELHKFAKSLPGLKLHAQTFLDRQMNGRVLLECSYSQLVTAMKNESVTLVDAQSIIQDYIEPIKNEEKLNPEDTKKYEVINIVNKIWDEMCKITEKRFRLLPQHLRDFSKPAPTYQPPPQYYAIQQQQHQQQQRSHYDQSRHHPQSRAPHASYRHHDDSSGTPPLYEVKNVMDWNTEDCIMWLGQIKESKVDLRVRYTPHFEQIKMAGPTLLNMTPSTLSSICCITTKTHLKQLVKAIDKIRDYLVFTTFAQLPHVKEFTSKYGGGYALPPTRYQQTNYNYQPPTKITTAAASQSMATTATTATATTTTPKTNTTTNTKDSNAQQQGNKPSSKSQQNQNAACFVCGATGNVMRCSQCKQAFYCSREHQVDDWARHSKDCQKNQNQNQN